MFIGTNCISLLHDTYKNSFFFVDYRNLAVFIVGSDKNIFLYKYSIFSPEKKIELLMNTLYTANQETVRYFYSVVLPRCRDLLDQNFDR